MTEPFTAAGIGDMSGDVFGNGMLLSRQMRLLAAFDHRHIFIDPDPDPEASFDERARMFALPTSSWDDYDRELISAGGGIWPRIAKSIPLSPQAREALGIEAERLTPTEVIHAILCAPVDLLWNGGIGTYVKAASESHADVGDRTNDAVRADGRELRARVVGEGGNLGLTQRGRIEYAGHGGRINIDAIDNSAGVDCSDHEVNLKILLDLGVRAGEMSHFDRDEVLRDVTDDVVRHVLQDSYLQAQIIAQEVSESAARVFAYEDLMAQLEEEGFLHRSVEKLPPSDVMAERRRAGDGLVRPELAVLLADAKLSLTDALLDGSLVDDPFFETDLREYFPALVIERCGHLLGEHPLRRELVATIVSNHVVNALGPTFVSRLVAEQGAEPADVVRGYRIARDVTGAEARWAAIERLSDLDRHTQWKLMEDVDELVEATARWYLENAPGADLGAAIAAGREGFGRLTAILGELGSDSLRQAREREVAAGVEQGVPEELARSLAYLPGMAHAPDVIAASQTLGRSVEDVGRTFSLLEDRAGIAWIEQQLGALPVSTRMQRWALQALRDDLWRARRDLAQRALEESPGAPVPEAVEAFVDARPDAMRRLAGLTRAMAGEGGADLAGLTLAVRQLRALAA
jgi:glutamate dehydrogenase